MSFIMALGADCHQPQAQCARAHASKRLMNPWSGAQAPRDESPQESTMLSTVQQTMPDLFVLLCVALSGP